MATKSEKKKILIVIGYVLLLSAS